MERKPFQLPKMTQGEIKELIKSEKICRIAFQGKKFPYIAPFQYIQNEDTMYFHFTNYGKKIRLIDTNNRVCVTVEHLESDMSEFQFVVMQGELLLVQDKNERALVIQKLALEGKTCLSTKFLAAHGFSEIDGWGVLSDEKPLSIYKLVEISSIIGLRSPQ